MSYRGFTSVVKTRLPGSPVGRIDLSLEATAVWSTALQGFPSATARWEFERAVNGLVKELRLEFARRIDGSKRVAE